MTRLRLILLLAAFAGLPALALAADDVIYPRNAAAPGAPSENRSGGASLLTGVLGLAAVAGAGWFWWRNRAMGGGGPGRSERKLTIAETRPLGNRQHLLVADYAGKKYLLGVCPGRIDLLTPLDGEKARDS